MANKHSGKEVFDIHKTLPPKDQRSAPSRLSQAERAAQEISVKKKRGISFKRLFASTLLILFLFILTIGIWDAVELSNASKKMFGSGNLFSLFGGDLASHNGRTNILLVGYSADDAGHQGATLTDSIMLISLDSSNKSGYILSIPRDLWVKIPGNGYAKINEAYQDGERDNFYQDGYPAGGMGLLESIVSDKFNLPIDYYSLINYAAFRDTVDAVGGITINIKSNDPRGIYDPSLDYTSYNCCALADYPNGPVTLNGKQALNLARARGDAYGSYGFGQADFDRTEHQRQMLLALKQKSSSSRLILDPRRSAHLFDGMANNVKTDLSTGNVLPLYRLYSSVNNSGLKSISLRNLNGKNYLTDYGGALIPAAGTNDYTDIQEALSQFN